MEAEADKAAYRAALEAHGHDAMAFEGLKAGMRHWRDPDSTAVLAFADVAGAWVAVGAPRDAEVAGRFELAARAAKKRALFFGAEQPLPGWSALPLGEQPIFEPGAWARALGASRRLREQLRRAKKKKVSVRSLDGSALEALRPRVESLARGWLAAHHLEPLGFVVAVEPFYEADRHRYLAAELDGRLVGFLSAVPIPASSGWLIEDVFRAPDAPNGTSELLIDAFMRLASRADPAPADLVPAVDVTLGLAPLTGELPFWLRLARFAARPLYDFDGLAAYKRRLHASRWAPVWLLHKGPAPLALVPVLRAFAACGLLRFGARSLLSHPSGPPFAMALPLALWAALLAVLAATGGAPHLGIPTPRLWAWVAFDIALMVVLYLAALRPRPARLLAALGLAAIDAGLSVAQVAQTGLGSGPLEVALRLLAVAAPLLGTAALTWAWSRARGSPGNMVGGPPTLEAP